MSAGASLSALPRLAYVVHSLDPGGTERLVVDMALAFSEEFDVSVYCLDTVGAWATQLREQGVPVHCVWRQPGLDVSVPVQLARHFRRAGVDLIHAHQCTPWFYAALSRIGYSAPKLLFEEHGRFYPESDSWLRRLVNRVVVGPLTDRFVAVSRDVRRRLVRFEGLKAHSIDVIYNGVQEQHAVTADERQSLRRELGFEDTDFVVGTVGRLDPIKNLSMFLQGFAAKADAVQQLKGLIVGGGPMASELAALSGSLGLDAKVKMTGFRSDARRLTACMDLFVLCSLSEGTSMALLESMAAGVPVVVTDVGGNPEIVEHGVSGLVIPSENVQALTEAIGDAVRNTGNSSDMALAGKRQFREKFSFDAMLDSYRLIYRELLPEAMNRESHVS
jgi:glycosyltransferase involved in cell wall biosynthesis